MESWQSRDDAHVRRFSADMQGYVNELERIGRRPVKTPADIDKISKDMDVVFAKMRVRHKLFVGKELSEEFRGSYKSTFNMPIGKRNTDISYRIRQRANKAGIRAINDLSSTWKNQRIRARTGAFGRSYFRDQFERQQQQLTSGGLSPSQKKKLMADMQKTAKEYEKYKDAPASSAHQKPRVLARRRRGNKRGQVVSNYPADRYFDMLGKTSNQEVSTTAYLQALGDGDAKGKQYVMVSDGTDCGWTSHRDSQKANGMIVTIEEAKKYPLAHPNCQRRFAKADGPPGSKKARDQFKEMFGVENRRALERIAKAGVIIGKTAGAASLVGRSPFIRGFVRDILSDQEIRIPISAQKLLQKWVNGFAKREETALLQYGAGADEFEYRTGIMGKIDEVGLDQDFLTLPNTRSVTISDELAKTLGVSARLSKGRFLEAAEDYADWVRWKRGEALDTIDNLAEQSLEAQVRYELYGDAAISYNMSAVRSAKVSEQLKNISRVYTEALSKRPDRLGVEAARAAGALLDPMPWFGVRQGNFRFMLGLSSDGRRDLAEFLYSKARGNNVYNQMEIDWAKQLGLDEGAYKELIQKTFTRQDIVNSLLPRVTYFGSPMSATLSLNTGKLMPVVRLMPENFLLRNFAITARLRSNALTAFVDDFKLTRWDSISRVTKERILNGLEENLITTIDVFRSGPIAASMRLYGTKYDSFALKLRTNNENLRYTYRYYSRTNKIIVGQDDNGRNIYAIITGFDEAGEPVYKKVKPSYRDLVAGGGGVSELRIGRWQTITILPREAGGIKFGLNKGDVGDLIMGMLKWRGSLIEVARVLGADYESMLLYYTELRKQIITNYPARWRGFQDELAELQKIIERRAYDGIRSLDDLRYLGRDFRGIFSETGQLREFSDELADMLGDQYTIQDAMDDLSGTVDERLLSLTNVPQKFIDDVVGFYRWWDTKYGRAARPTIVMADELAENNPMVYNQFDKIIYVDERWARNWSSLENARFRMVVDGHFPAGTQEMIGNVVHESAHHIRALITNLEYVRVWETILGSMSWPKKPPVFTRSTPNPWTKDAIDKAIRNWMRDPQVSKAIAYRISNYALADPAEMFAELLSEAALSGSPSDIAVALRDYEFITLIRRLRGV